MNIKKRKRNVFNNAQKQQILSDCLQSGLTKENFSKVRNVSTSSLNRWAREFSSENTSKQIGKFIPVTQTKKQAIKETVMIKIKTVELVVPINIDEHCLATIIQGVKQCF